MLVVYDGTDLSRLHVVLLLVEYQKMLDFDDSKITTSVCLVEVVSCVVPEVRPSRKDSI